MPMFETSTGEERFLEATRPVFKRGRRLGDVQLRRIRDVWLTLLHSLGMDHEDLSAMTKLSLSSRQSRNRVAKVPAAIASELAKIAREILLAERTKLDDEWPAPVKPKIRKPKLHRPRVTKPACQFRQLSLFDDPAEEVTA